MNFIDLFSRSLITGKVIDIGRRKECETKCFTKSYGEIIVWQHMQSAGKMFMTCLALAS